MELCKALLVFGLVSFISSSKPYSDEEISEIKKDLKSCIKREDYPRFVQLAFHDCVGGCDGYVDTSNPANKGLPFALESASALKTNFTLSMEDADWFALLGSAVIEKASNDGVIIDFKSGRKTCSGQCSDRHFPDGFDPHALEFLKDEFGLEDDEAVALVGCHSLGGMAPRHSGYGPGPWDRTPFSLDNQYFKELNNSKGWNLETVSNENANSSQWRRAGLVFLHADIGMMVDYNVTGTFDSPSCLNLVQCERASTSPLVQHFAEDELDFYRVLKVAFEKMINNF